MTKKSSEIFEKNMFRTMHTIIPIIKDSYQYLIQDLNPNDIVKIGGKGSLFVNIFTNIGLNIINHMLEEVFDVNKSNDNDEVKKQIFEKVRSLLEYILNNYDNNKEIH